MDSCNFTNKANSHSFEVEIHTLQKLCHFGRCVHMRDRLVSEISVFATEISVTGMKIFPYEHSIPGDRDETFVTK